MTMGMMVCVVAAMAFVVTSLLGLWLIPQLRRLRLGQNVSETGPVWHQKKQGTPTMGGMMFITGILAASLTGCGIYQLSVHRQTIPAGLAQMDLMKFFLGLLLACGFGAVGFLDDYIKVVKKRRPGLSDRQKFLLEALVSVGYLLAVYLAGDRSTVLYLPFLGKLHLGLFYYPLAILLMIWTVDAVNLTDGLDGLCSSVTFVASLGLMVVCSVLSHTTTGFLAAAAAGGCLGFLVWNFYPAKVFMGNLGSTFLGGVLVAVAFGAGVPALLVLVGIVYFAESLSVVIQRIYFRITGGKRLFKMTPVHHHYEMKGYSEVKITAIFSAATAVGCLLALLSVRYI